MPEMRVHPMRLLRSVLIFVVVLFALLNMHVLLNMQSGQQSADSFKLSHVGEGGHVQFHVHNNDLRYHPDNGQGPARDAGEPSIFIPPVRNNSHHDNRSFPAIDMTNITMIRNAIRRINLQQQIFNLNKFGLKLNSESVVIVIQTHDRAEYLQILLDSLRNVRDIQQTLVIVSHDVYSETLNKIVQSVDFCPILQIFFPHSIQAYPYQFPGDDPKDCPRNIKKEEALKRKCNNAEYPDKYGHYREAKYSQTKHHWWWKLNRVFDGLTIMKNYEGLVLLLEEDYYLAEDSITVLRMLNHLRDRDCADCQIITLGNYDKTQNYPVNSGKVETAHWISSKHNLGMGFTRKLWNQMRACAKEYCLFDDYNWDWTVQHLSTKCLPQKLKVMKMKASRVFHMGECGLHQKKKDCQPQDKRKLVEAILKEKRQFLFPNVLIKVGFSPLKLRDPKPNGGWGDLRDRQLCLSFNNLNTSAPTS